MGKTPQKKKIIIAVLALAIVILALGLGLGLGLKKKDVAADQPSWVEGECDDLSAPACPAGVTRQPLLLVSLDGLRPDYLQKWNQMMPVLNKLSKCGTSAPFMQAAFPSKTFPNHYTIVTGLYPESNGLIDNVMYDPVINATFSLSSEQKSNPAWYLGQPIWHTARYQGLRSGTFFWPGSDVKINGSFPDIHRQFDGNVPFEERVSTVLQWLQLPEDQRPDFFTLYLEEPDKSGHSYGPDGEGMVPAVQDVDRIMGQLMDGLKRIGFHRCLNIIVLADHGMEEMNCSRKENLQELVGDVSRYWVTQGPFGRVRPRDKDAEWDPAGLVANMTCKKPEQKIKAYLKAHLPKRLHFANSQRIEDVSVLVDVKWLFERSPGSLTFCSGGNHGYDNDAASMHAMFLSYGPKFLSKTEIEPFSNIELYNLMCDVLQISPADNNGTHGSLNHLLKQPFFTPSPPAEVSQPGRCQMTSLVPEDGLGCSCSAPGVNISNSRLNLTTEEASAAEKIHLPFGRPRMLQPNQSYCVLHHEGFVSGYSRSRLMPLWSSFTIHKPDQPDPLPPVVPDCLRPDVRIASSQSPRCDQHAAAGRVTHAFLYPPNLNVTAEQRGDGLLLSNVVPMYPAFQRVWAYIHSTLLQKYAFLYQGVNVVAGPVFDDNYDGQYDPAEQSPQSVSGANVSIPSHYFLLLTSCRDSAMPVDGCHGELQTVSFLLPHRPDNSESCESAGAESTWVEDLMWFHQSRVRDVEWAAGLDFYQDSSRPIAELLKVKTRPTAAIARKQ